MPKPNARTIEAMIKTRWKALSDIFQFTLVGHGERRKIAERPNRQRHQADKEKKGEPEDAVNHLFLGNQVHKKAGDEEGLATGNDQRDGDVDLTAGEMNVRSPDGQNCADDERD